MLLIASTNLDGYSLTNHGQFAKFAKLSQYNGTNDGLRLGARVRDGSNSSAIVRSRCFHDLH